MATSDVQSVSDSIAPVLERRPTEALEISEAEPAAAATAQDVPFPPRKEFIPILVGLAVTSVVLGLDIGIIATAVPTITDHFHTLNDVGWYYSAFRLCSCAFLFMWGKLYQIFSIKICFLMSLFIFAGGNLLCGLAPTSKALVLGRAICGLGTGGGITGLFTIMMGTVPLRHRPAFGAVGGMIETIAATAAPVLGGVITEKLSWRWCFYINLPVCGVAFAIMLFFYKGPPPVMQQAQQLSGLTWTQKFLKTDPVGTILFVPGITCLLLALQYGGTTYGWSNPRIIVLFIVFAVLTSVFGYWQYRQQEEATIVPRIIRNRSILGGMLFGACIQAALAVCDYYMPIYFQAAKERTPSQSGILTLPIVIGLAIGCLFGGTLTSALGYYVPFMLLTSILMPIATGLLTTLSVNEQYWRLVLIQGLLGLGGGIGIQAPQSAASTVLAARDGSLGIAAIMFAFSLGPALGVTAAQSIFTSRLTSDLARYAPGVNASVLETVGLTGLKSVVGGNGTLTQEVLLSYDKAITQTFYLPVALACLSMLGAGMMEWKSVKEKKS